MATETKIGRMKKLRQSLAACKDFVLFQSRLAMAISIGGAEISYKDFHPTDIQN
jgi:hypothetical protein